MHFVNSRFSTRHYEIQNEDAELFCLWDTSQLTKALHLFDSQGSLRKALEGPFLRRDKQGSAAPLQQAFFICNSFRVARASLQA